MTSLTDAGIKEKQAADILHSTGLYRKMLRIAGEYTAEQEQYTDFSADIASTLFISYQNILNSLSKKKKNPLLHYLLSDNTWPQVLGINEWNGSTWINAERSRCAAAALLALLCTENTAKAKEYLGTYKKLEQSMIDEQWCLDKFL
jgi:hypothetical protein